MLRIALGVLFAVFMPVAAFAALVPTPSIPLAVSAAPAYQTPGESVTLTAYASVPKGVFTYSWSVDGKDLVSGIDRDSVTVTAGAAGTESTVSVTISNDAGSAGSAQYLIAPADVDLLWEGATSVPYFYPGKAYPNGESPIVLAAVPHFVADGKPIPPGALNYAWTVDGVKRDALSGYGRSSVRISPTQFKTSTKVTVTVEVPGGGAAAQATVSVPHVVPSIFIYEDRPLAGLWTQTAVTGTFPLSGDEAGFRAVPFFVVNPNGLTYSWALDDKGFAPPGDDPAAVTFRKTGSSGSATVSVDAEKQGSIFERMRGSFTISFE